MPRLRRQLPMTFNYGRLSTRLLSLLVGVCLLAGCTSATPAAPTAAPAKPAAAPAPAEKPAAAASPAAAKAPEASSGAAPAVKVDTKAIEDFYKGKTVRIVVGFAPGGGYDTYGR